MEVYWEKTLKSAASHLTEVEIGSGRQKNLKCYLECYFNGATFNFEIHSILLVFLRFRSLMYNLTPFKRLNSIGEFLNVCECFATV